MGAHPSDFFGSFYSLLLLPPQTPVTPRWKLGASNYVVCGLATLETSLRASQLSTRDMVSA